MYFVMILKTRMSFCETRMTKNSGATRNPQRPSASRKQHEMVGEICTSVCTWDRLPAKPGAGTDDI
jgi:hypothetical protein